MHDVQQCMCDQFFYTTSLFDWNKQNFAIQAMQKMCSLISDLHCQLNPFLNNKIVDPSELKAFADYNLKLAEMMEYCL